MPPFQVLLLCAMASGAVALGSAWAAWPRLRALEARGIVRTPVPDLFEGRAHSWRTAVLIWATPIPADRKRLRLLLLLCRSAQVAAFLFMAAAVIAMANSQAVAAGRAPDQPDLPPITIQLVEPAAGSSGSLRQ